MEFRLLGPVEVHQDGHALPLGGRRQRVVLTHLLLSRDTAVPSDLLIEQVWGDSAPAAVRASLHTYISRLRTTLGTQRLETRSQGYVLHADDAEVDASRFEQALSRARALAEGDPEAATACYDQALSLWRGPALGDLSGEPSLGLVATHLESLRDQAVEAQIRARLAAGHHVEVLPRLEDLLQRNGLREDLWAHYVLALYRCGRQADALAAFGRARRVLRDELGVEPGDTLRLLHQQVLRHDQALTLPGTALHGYRLLEVLGEGGSSVVHRAVQPTVGREVALKVVRRSLADDPRLVQGFATAAQAAANVVHPHVVPLHDFWRGPGGAYLVLRLLKGGSLADVLHRGSLTVGELVRLVDQLAGALDACHRHGVVHQAITPRHVLLDEDGNAYVSPFVLARELAWTSARAPVHSAGSTLRLPGSSGALPRPDVAALGRLLAQLTAALPVVPAAVGELADRAREHAGADWSSAEALADALRAAAAPAVPAQRLAAAQGRRPRNPYKGLRAFTEADAGDFFGRATLVDRMVQRLAQPQRFLAVVGPSGSGKSSVVRAGLVPALRAGALPTVDRWYVADVVPGPSPLGELVTALRHIAVTPLPEDLLTTFRTDAGSLARLTEALLPDDALGQTSELLLLVDQFEELFTLADRSEERAFVDLLVAAATEPGSRVRVVVTLRADFYDRPLGRPALAELLRKGTEVVPPLSAAGLEQAVVEPAELVGLTVEPALLAQVVADVQDAPGALPLLQYALTEVAERTSDGVLSLTTYQEVGGVAGALVRRADAVHARFTPGQQHVAQQVLLALVQPGDPGGAVTRRRVLQAELVQRTDDPDTAQAVVDALGAARLLAFDRHPTTRAPTVEIAHEALLREWDLLRGWADAAHDDLRIAQRLTTAAREWEEAGRDPSFLAVGSRLDVVEQWAERWSATTGWTPTRLEAAYLEESERARAVEQRREQARQDRERELEHRSVRRLRAVAAALALAVVLASALTVFGFTQRHRAEQESLVAQARALAAASAASLEEDPERAALLALEAVRRTRDTHGWVIPQAEDALHRATVASRVVRTLAGVGGALDWGARGLIVSEGPDQSGRIDLRNATTGESLRTFHGHDVDVNEVSFSPDGRHLLTTGDDGAARLWDPGTGRLLWELRTRGQVWGPSFSGDGRRLAAAWQSEGVVRVVDVATGRVLNALRSVAEPAATALDGDGKRVVLAGSPAPGAVVHDVGSGARLMHVAADGPPAFGVDLSPDGRLLATYGVDGKARLWSTRDGTPRGTLYSSAPVAELDWSPDSSRAVVGGDDGVARVFAVTAEGTRELLRLSASGLRGITGAAFSPDGTRVVLGDSPADTAQIWDVSPQGSREWLTVAVPQLDVLAADFTGDGRHVVVSSTDGAVAFVDEAGRRLRSTPPRGGTVALLRTSPDGRLVAGSADRAARVWSVDDGRELFSVPLGGGPLGLAWSPDGWALGVTSQDGRLRLVDRAGHALPRPVQDPRDAVRSVGFSPDGDLLVTAHRPSGRGALGSGHVQVWDRQQEKTVRRWTVDTDTLAVAPRGHRVATALRGGDVVLWDLRTGRRQQTLVGHAGPVWDFAFSADGTRLATSGQDATVRLWDVRTGDELLVLRAHESVVFTVRFSPDGRRLVTASGDGTVRVWALALDDLVALASAHLTRELSEAECRRFLQRSC